MVEKNLAVDTYFDLTHTDAASRYLIETTLQDLMRSAMFGEVLEKMYAQYGRVEITTDAQRNTLADITLSPPRLNLNLEEIETSGYMLPAGKNGGQRVLPMTLHRALAHEVSHFAQDKHELKQLMKQRMADMIQEALLYGSEREAIAKELARDYAHFPSFFGYQNNAQMVDEMAHLPSLDRNEYVQRTEVAAMQKDNAIMKEVYVEEERMATAKAYVDQTVRRRLGFRCALDTILQVEGVAAIPSEPCAYGYIPGKQESRITPR